MSLVAVFPGANEILASIAELSALDAGKSKLYLMTPDTLNVTANGNGDGQSQPSGSPSVSLLPGASSNVTVNLSSSSALDPSDHDQVLLIYGYPANNLTMSHQFNMGSFLFQYETFSCMPDNESVSSYAGSINTTTI
ncbi:hypothetical protein C8J56DRAFT_1065419 [Mycena floridula]|nr:hypothetical protein C8J56DRAFT_1065419 [Mycena floridula]